MRRDGWPARPDGGTGWLARSETARTRWPVMPVISGCFTWR